MNLNSKKIDINNTNNTEQLRYTICTMVTNWRQYKNMLESFQKAGFTNDVSEYLHIDNTENNDCDAFKAINHFTNNANGKYIIICHQDVLVDHDTIDQLDKCLTELNTLDQEWALAGNSGGVALYKCASRITDPNGEANTRNLPKKVHSLDENFVVLRANLNISTSQDLSGFHLYGVDLCIQAALRGHTAYAINFHLTHLSPGNIDREFFEAKGKLIDKYQRALSGRYFQTPCTNFYLSGSRLINLIMNKKTTTKAFKNFEKWKNSISKRLRTKNDKIHTNENK